MTRSTPCPPSPVGSNVSMGSTPVPEGTPMVEDPLPSPSDPPEAPEYPDGVDFKNHSNIAFKGSSENADNDFRIADIALN